MNSGCSASRCRRGNLVNGAKTFITNGINADLVITAVRTSAERHRGISLLVLERGMAGFERGRGFEYLMRNLPQERMQIAVACLARARAGLRWTIEYVGGRTAFGQPIGGFQNTKFTLADVSTEVAVAEAFIDRCVLELDAGRLTPADAAKAKLWASEMEFRCLDRCQQLFGGYGYMREYPIARAAADARVTRVYGGTSEIMREIIGRDLKLTQR